LSLHPDAAYAARLMAETDEGLATEVMGWEWDAWGYWLGLPDEDGCRPILGTDWHPSSDWSDWGLVFAKVSTPTPDGQLVRQLWVGGPSSEGSWTSTATASGGEVYNGFGSTPLAAKADATLKAVRGRKVVLERQAEWAWRQTERLAQLDERKGRGKS